MVKSLTNRLYLKGKLHIFRMVEGISLKDHLDDYNKLLLDLANIGVNVDEEDKALILIYSLPKSYENITTTMLYGRETISLNEVEATLLSNELRLKVQLEHQAPNPVQGLTVRGRDEQRIGGQGRNKSKTRSKSRFKRPGVCHYCKKPGHWKNECRLLQSKKEKEQKNKGTISDSASVAVSSADHSSVADDAVFTAACSISQPDTWIVDSGASFHMTPHKEWFTSFRSCDGGSVLLGDDAICKVQGIGIVQIKSHANTVVTLDDVRYVPQLKRNLLSVNALDIAGFEGRWGRGSITISKGALTLLRGKLSGTLYYLDGTTVVGEASSAHSSIVQLTQLWHQRLGHMSDKGLQELSRRGLLGGQKVGALRFCEHCIFGKQHRVSFTSSLHRTAGILDYIHSDLWGPAPVTSKGGSRYLLTLIDDYSRKVWIYTIKNKSDVFHTFKGWKAMVERQTERNVKTL